MRKLQLSIQFYFLFFLTQGQVREATSRAIEYRSDRHNDYSSNVSYSNSSVEDEDSFFEVLLGDWLFGSIYEGLKRAQYDQLNNAVAEEWRIGFEAKLNGGINPQNVEFFDSQMIRGNYGILSTQLRRFSVSDVSGSFTTIDWQMLQLNLINRKNIRWVFGSGISHETQVDQTHFEWATELSFSLASGLLMPIIGYRKSADGYPRREVSAAMEIRPFKFNIKDVAFSAGYTVQHLYEVPFRFLTAGVSLYLR